MSTSGAADRLAEKRQPLRAWGGEGRAEGPGTHGRSGGNRPLLGSDIQTDSRGTQSSLLAKGKAAASRRKGYPIRAVKTRGPCPLRFDMPAMPPLCRYQVATRGGCSGASPGAVIRPDSRRPSRNDSRGSRRDTGSLPIALCLDAERVWKTDARRPRRSGTSDETGFGNRHRHRR